MSGNDPVCTAPSAGPQPSAACAGTVSHTLAWVARLHRIGMGRRLRDLGLYPGQELMMMRLWDCGAVRQSELIQSLGLDPSTVTKMLQRMEQCGYVRRSPDPADRRAVLVEATERGLALRAGVEGAWADLEESTLAGLAPAERTELARLLGLVGENLKAEADEEGPCGPGAGGVC
ncbi:MULTISPECIES: MarR family winged helix-turn-helix transcriptional regulator [Streptomyces]|jgi:MarR family transcriptional regulator, organic hydroperoxide resistance regulator|uniref:DNA-binding MarR family transcriptional regulator n=1 Tax=Streptomyces nymphaeiformis TaxID=2663842 RepID=A0A7W7TVZ9_9ACTN|nr:MarR family winged helix-turn-helix transcriptional regulator [Streptomyces nymphaeiformis]MBB4980233.1 DNA-binding MarR family transcriptional regulator [Streptomyces nymphaeiformis]